jgi:hypothetical protein
MADTIEWVVPDRLARACRPGRWDERDLSMALKEWLSRAQQLGVRSILCLLTDAELHRHYGSKGLDLLSRYKRAGFQVGRLPVADHKTPPLSAKELRHVDAVLRHLPPPWQVHCSAGIDRTGFVVTHLQSK